MTAALPVTIDVVVESPQWEAEANLEAAIHEAVAAALAAGDLRPMPGAELAVILADDAHVRSLNREWRDQDKPTNVLSFPGAGDDEDPEEVLLLGDVVIAYETVKREAEEAEKPFRHHLAHLVVHGTLHLFGYDHIEPDEAEAMEETERQALARLAIPDPYAETQPI